MPWIGPIHRWTWLVDTVIIIKNIVMKKLMAAMAALTLAVPVLAEPEIKQWNTPHAMGCMLLRECKEGVLRVETVDNIKAAYPGVDYSGVEAEMTDMLAIFEELGIEVYLADAKYFMPRTRGVYSTDGNKFFLNVSHMYDPETILEVTRHEGWHAAQDCMAGSLQNSHIAVIHQDGYIPEGYRIRADVAYRGGPAVPWETEAMWAAEQPYVTANALRACAHPEPMWTVYPPTPMTGEWLVNNGYWDGVTK